jgi:hypothetical protein
MLVSLLVTALATGNAASSPQYPLLHIGAKINCSHAVGGCTKNNNADGGGRDYPYVITDADAEALGKFQLLHLSTKSAAQVAKIHKHSAHPLIKYIESVPVCGGSAGQTTPYVICNDTHNFETGGFRIDATVYHAANLTSAIGKEDTTLSICMAVPYCCNHYATLLVPSTAAGNFSEYHGSKYVTFARLGNELLKIVAVQNMSNPDPKSHAVCQTLTVQRGLDGTMSRAVPAGAPLLAPTFVHTPVWSGPKASGKLAFQAQYSSFYAWSSLTNFTVDAIQQLGYDGAWVDSFSPSEIRNGAGVGGEKVSVWNLNATRPYTPQEAYDEQMDRLQRVWAETHKMLGRYPVIWANNFEGWLPKMRGSHYVPGDRIFMLGENGTRPFDGCSLESWGADFDGPGCWAQNGDAAKWRANFHDEATWQSRINTVIDASVRELAVAAMTGSAGCQSQLQVYLAVDNRTQLDLFVYGSYLLAVQTEGGTDAASKGPLVGTSAYFAPVAGANADAVDASKPGHAGDVRYPAGVGVAKLNVVYTWALGAPLQLATNVTEYRDTVGVYARRFKRGLVLVNPGENDAQTATALNGTYVDPSSSTPSKPLTEVRMAAHSGLILLLAP